MALGEPASKCQQDLHESILFWVSEQFMMNEPRVRRACGQSGPTAE